MKSALRVLLFFLISLNVFGLANIHPTEDTDPIPNIESCSSLHAADFSNHPFNSPAEPNPLPNEEENTEKKDNVEEEEWRINNHSSNIDFNNIKRTISTNLIVKQLIQELSNRKQISLYILYCSWNSFLS